VSFDITADGRLDSIGWTRPGSEDAFLWLDRNGNGVVDDGSELFGNAARLRNGERATSGFELLKEFDSNNDGIIDSRDPIWQSLRLWFDRNHNGISEPSEMECVADSDIVGLRLNYRFSTRRDQFGNLFRWKSNAIRMGPRGNLREEPFYDVVLAH
jgi:hypothetical protein